MAVLLILKCKAGRREGLRFVGDGLKAQQQVSALLPLGQSRTRALPSPKEHEKWAPVTQCCAVSLWAAVGL